MAPSPTAPAAGAATPAATLPISDTLPVPLPLLAPAAPVDASPRPPTTAEPLSLDLDLSLTVDPAWAEPGDVVTFTLTAANRVSAPLASLTVIDALPKGLVYVPKSGQGFTDEPQAQQLTWAVGDLAAGAVLTGRFQARVQGVTIGETVTNTVTAFAPGWPAAVTAQAALEVAPPRNDAAWATPDAGGLLRSTDDRVLLRVPAGAVAARTRFTYRPAPDVPTPLPGLRFAFTVAAQDDGGQPRHSFDAPLVLTLVYRPEEVPATAEAPVVYYFDETAGQWTALPTQLDRARRQLQVTVPHLTLFAAATTSLSYGAQHLPTVHGFVSDEWSGNSSVSYPIALPPGPAGLGLNLSLSYSSEGVNSIRQGPGADDETKAKTFDRQASFVGWGWSLNGLGQITSNIRNGKTYLGYAGGGFELKYDATNGWQTEPQSFLRIEHGASTTPWHVWAPDGAKYTFGSAVWGNGVAWIINGADCGRGPREAHLTEVQDPHGNRAVITYAAETKGIMCNGSSLDYVRAIRPTSIEYFASGQSLASVRVDFGYNSRTDTGVPGQNDEYTESFWSSQRLTTIEAKVRNSATAYTRARAYTLNHDTLWLDQATGKGLLRLLSAVESGTSPAVTLPAWTFTYVTMSPLGPASDWFNHTLLQTASTGQGGSVTYTYGNVNIWMEGCGGNSRRYRVQQMDVADGLGNVRRTVYDHQSGWAWTGPGWPDCPDFEFGGYSFVRSQLQDGSAALYQVVENTYHQRTGNALDPRKGKLSLSVTSSAVGSGELARSATTWSTATIKGRTWVYQADTTSTLGASSQKTAYEYQTADQSGAQYGNVTHVKTYRDGGTTLYRTQETVYYPRNDTGGAYIVNRPARQLLQDAAGACQGETRTWYDANTAYDQPPTQGDATKTQVAQTSCGGTWSETRYGYDSWGNQLSVTDPLTHTTTTVYDTTPGNWPMLFALPTSTTAPLVGTTTYVWNKVLGQVTSVSDPNGAVTSYVYDEFGRQTKLIQPGDDTANPTVKLAYSNYASASAPYWVKQEQKENGTDYLVSHTYYDGLGRVVQTQAEAELATQSIIASARYNPLGVIQATAPYTHTAGLGVNGNYRTPDWNQPGTRTVYDALGRVTQVTQPDNSVVRSYYQDRQTAVIDPLQHQTIQATDALGRLISSQQYIGSYPGAPGWNDAAYAQAQYQYDVADRLTQVSGPDSAATNLTYDLAGRKTQMVDPDMGTWLYRYDAAGNLVKQRDARNTLICHFYDALNRLTGKSYHPNTSDPSTVLCYQQTPTVTYSYDIGTNGKGRRTGMTDGSGSASWTYDARGRTTQETKVINGTGGGTFVTQWEYDSANRPKLQKYPGNNASQIGESVSFAYTPQGLLDTVIGAATYVGDTQSNVRGQVAERRLGSPTGVLRQRYAYSAAENFRLVSLKAGKTSPNYYDLQRLSYTYDDNGNVLTITDAAAYGGSQTQTFTYDPLDRLSTAQASGGSNGLYNESYVDSANGNLTSKTGVGNYAYDAQAADCPEGVLSKPHAVVTAGSYAYCYDQNGNMRRRKLGADTYLLTYDAENRLTAMSGGVTSSYVYDGDGNRVKETVAGVVRVFIGNYYEVAAGVVKKYYYAGATRVAENSGGTLYYLLGDHLGSTSVTTDASGNRLTELRYMPYGGSRYNPGSQITTFRFTGQRWDSGTAIYFYGARWYDPYLNRWIQPDTIVPDSNDTAVSALTVSFSENDLLMELNRENRGDRPCGLGIVETLQEPALQGKPFSKNGATCETPPIALKHTGPANPQNLNRYAYVRNNPLRYTDPTGHWTFGIGLGITIGVGGGASGSILLVFDDNGNFGVALGGGGGGYAGAGGSAGIILQGTNADVITELNGPVVQTGGSVDVGLSVGAEWVVQKGPQHSTQGANINVGVGIDAKIPCPIEMHSMLEGTKVKVLVPAPKAQPAPFKGGIRSPR